MRDAIAKMYKELRHTAHRLKFRYAQLFVFELSISDWSPRLASKVTVQTRLVATIDDLKPLIAAKGGWPRRFYEERLEKGDLGFIAEVDGKTVSCLWATFNEVYLADVEYNLKLDNQTVALIGAYTLPDYRGQGIYAKVWEACITHFKGSSYSRAYGFIEARNLPSLVAHKKIGLEKVIKVIIMLKFLGLKINIVRDVANC
ncbi:MAG: GNAT family N-acetyltransferase [Candidatus Methanosuratincola sp.]|nr:GNAT family N-acetyltransferase [Candidatus Methanosuratincola sp.]